MGFISIWSFEGLNNLAVISGRLRRERKPLLSGGEEFSMSPGELYALEDAERAVKCSGSPQDHL
jgi:hypothetical protein